MFANTASKARVSVLNATSDFSLKNTNLGLCFVQPSDLVPLNSVLEVVGKIFYSFFCILQHREYFKLILLSTTNDFGQKSKLVGLLARATLLHKSYCPLAACVCLSVCNKFVKKFSATLPDVVHRRIMQLD